MPPLPTSQTGEAPSSDECLLQVSGAALVASQEEERTLLEGVAWEVRRGDFWVVSGSPGTGKSELLEGVVGLAPTIRGECRLFGREIGEMSDRELVTARRRIGFVYSEGGRLINHLSVLQNIALPLCYHRNRTLEEVRGQLGALLEMTGLAHCLAWQPWRLKRSWGQRVALARALAMEPDLLILDEPTASLDTRQAKWWFASLEELCKGHAVLNGKPLTMIIAADDLRPWLGVAKNFAVLRDQRFVPLGGSADLASNQDPWLRELLAEASVNR